jgi:SWI/SNF-related matrix-associated actin-dependent regulator 1 of chromatin subfamily A
MTKWLIRSFSIEIANGTFPKSDIVVINYVILKKHRSAIDARQWDLLIADECHKAKNSKAQRTVALLGKRDKNPEKRVAGIAAKRRLFMTGTPIVNRPAELWTQVEALTQGWARRSSSSCSATPTRITMATAGTSMVQRTCPSYSSGCAARSWCAG